MTLTEIEELNTFLKNHLRVDNCIKGMIPNKWDKLKLFASSITSNKTTLKYLQKQPSRVVLRKMRSGNMQQSYRSPCRSVISIKLLCFALLCNFIEIAIRLECSLVHLLHIFRTPLRTPIEGCFYILSCGKECSPVLISSVGAEILNST